MGIFFGFGRIWHQSIDLIRSVAYGKHKSGKYKQTNQKMQTLRSFDRFELFGKSSSYYANEDNCNGAQMPQRY